MNNKGENVPSRMMLVDIQRNFIELDTAGCTVDQRNPVQQESAGKRPNRKYFKAASLDLV